MKRFRIMLSITVGAVLFLILVGGIVRSTGSGLGCPDWPKCFGQYIPPTDISQLPADYKEIFKVAGREIADFDPFKTWIEYINRLIGVLIGIFALLTAVFSLFVYRIDAKLTWLSLLGLLLIIIAGGVGAVVVRTHLSTGIITFHMVLALATLLVYIGTLTRSKRDQITFDRGAATKSFWIWGSILLFLTLTQTILGTQVREEVDVVAEAMGEESRSMWLEALGAVYSVHKFFYYAVVAAFIAWFLEVRKKFGRVKPIMNILYILGAVLLTEIAFGISMNNFGIPPILQPLHLLFATILIAGEFSVLGLVFFSKTKGDA